MKTIPITLIIFGIVVIIFPKIISYLIGGLLIFIGLNMMIFIKAVKKGKDNYVKFGNYKIFR